MATKVNYSDLSAPNYKTTIRIGTSKTTILFGDYGSCYGEYDETIAVNNSMNPVSTVDSTELIINYFSYHSPTTNGIVLAGKKFISDTPAGYIKFTSHGKTMIINVTIIGEAVEKNIEFNDNLNNYTVPVEDSNNCSLKLYYIYYEGKDSNGNWKKVTPTSNVLTDITLKFGDDNNVIYTEDNYSNQYVYWNNIPQNYIQLNLLPVTATATISIKNEIGEIISDTQTITFIDAIKRNIEFNDSLNNYKVYVEYTNNCSLNLYYIYYEGKDSDGNWKKVTPTSNVLTDITLKFDKNNVSYNNDNYSEQYINWDNIPQDYINILPTNAIATISITDYDESTISDKRTIQFISKYVINIKESAYTTCPNSTISISFEIKDNYENYCDVNNISSFSATLDNTNFTKSNCKFYSNKNTIEVTTSGTNGDTAKLTLKIGDIINEIITITNEITYSCGGIEEA